jgi:hypothetical protein
MDKTPNLTDMEKSMLFEQSMTNLLKILNILYQLQTRHVLNWRLLAMPIQ